MCEGEARPSDVGGRGGGGGVGEGEVEGGGDRLMLGGAP